MTGVKMSTSIVYILSEVQTRLNVLYCFRSMLHMYSNSTVSCKVELWKQLINSFYMIAEEYKHTVVASFSRSVLCFWIDLLGMTSIFILRNGPSSSFLSHTSLYGNQWCFNPITCFSCHRFVDRCFPDLDPNKNARYCFC